MARDSSGSHNEPVYSSVGAPADAADLSEVAAFAKLVGNGKTGTDSQRNALAGADIWPGLTFFTTDTKILYLTLDGVGWKPIMSDWIAYTATLTNFNIGTGGAAQSLTEYKWDMGRLRIRWRLYLGSSGQSVGSSVIVTIPAGIALRTPSTSNLLMNGQATLFDAGVAVYAGLVRYSNSNTDRFEILSTVPTTVGTAIITPSVPFNWGAGDGTEGELIVDVV